MNYVGSIGCGIAPVSLQLRVLACQTPGRINNDISYEKAHIISFISPTLDYSYSSRGFGSFPK